MNRPFFFLTAACVLVVTVCGAALHRNFDIYGKSKELETVGARLSRALPETVGSWRVALEPPLEEEVVSMLRCSGYINRVYLNEQTGDRVAVAVLVGPAGPIAVHTPEICYSSTHYVAEGMRNAGEVRDRSGHTHHFWGVNFKSTQVGGGRLRVAYAWSEGGNWQATEKPRFTHNGKPFLYKLQAAFAVDEEGHGDDSVCEAFLSEFIEQLKPHMAG